MTPTCMTPAELESWTAANHGAARPVSSPCFDCPLAFAVEMRAAGCCNGEPGPRTGRLRIGQPRVTYLGRRGQGRKYATDEARQAARRQQWRDSYARKKAAA